ncbi:uncharacterized protein LOC141900871 [Tubulanus polymorphus]|uniref:uncharacterized protein LOC141900871 n=1 Tax=Tubulanus polymorphus TaxID=672921 RepID=UPI003DA6615E
MDNDETFGTSQDDVDRATLSETFLSDAGSILTDAGYMSDLDKHSESATTPYRSRFTTDENIRTYASTISNDTNIFSIERTEYFLVAERIWLSTDGSAVDFSGLTAPDERNFENQIEDVLGQLNPSFHLNSSQFRLNDYDGLPVNSMINDIALTGLIGATSADYDIEPDQDIRERKASISRHSQTSPSTDDERMEVDKFRGSRRTPIWRSSFDATSRDTMPPDSPIAYCLDEPPPMWSPDERDKASRYRRKRKMSAHLNSFQKFTDKQIILMTTTAGLLRDRLTGENMRSLLHGLNASIRDSHFDIRRYPNNIFARSYCEMCEENIEVPPELTSLISFDTETGHLCRHKYVLLKEVGSLLRGVCSGCKGIGAVWDEMSVDMGVGSKNEAFVIDAVPDNTHRSLDRVRCIPRDLDESIDFLREEIRVLTIKNVSAHHLIVLRRRLYDCLLIRAARQRRLKSALSGIWCIAYNTIFTLTPLTIQR